MDGCAHAQLLKADRQPFSGPRGSQRPQEGEPTLVLPSVCNVLSPLPGGKSLCPAALSTAAVVSWGQKATGHGEGQLLRQKAQLGQRLLPLSGGREDQRGLAGSAADGWGWEYKPGQDRLLETLGSSDRFQTLWSC